ncbi:MAG: bifunctional 5,10-methylenetetrahydrofolate dehydrogenase/5,10-methenyltetrahydrofolate cyclohydrolase [Caldilineaceae bacterium SB0668_bin_21]|nr:bifunctional 5,10-methylenetetrahydrofolate dehydrogenase/5,10-methenyltetrahydrofolate cyclohydrolase [Caldilineaceae bacterium SB0668_bin_21]MYB39849.1 bifunctional 5,10-methylenetetrahydrofolate dehydrogenase/5,10-methenyltetrahydrofolate cyclohydrolase [Candidatus Saccharibacteria bacterium]
MRLLDGKSLAEFIKARQIRELKKLERTKGLKPLLAIVTTGNNPVSDTYIDLKRKYAADIGVETSLHKCEQPQATPLIKKLGKDSTVTGIIVQLPLDDPTETNDICRLIPPAKDIDGLNPDSTYDSATATAIDWLLAGYGINLKDKKIAILGKGKLVGGPLMKLWHGAGLDVTGMDEDNLSMATVATADIIVTATGTPGLLTINDIKDGAVVVDAGTTSTGGGLVGDVDPDVYGFKKSLTITPRKGGVGPMTIAVLFERLLVAAKLNT